MSGDSAADRRAGSRDPDALLARAGVRGNPDHDQHFLVDDRVLDRLPSYATDVEMDTTHVLEVGAGVGGQVECDLDLITPRNFLPPCGGIVLNTRKTTFGASDPHLGPDRALGGDT